MTSTGRVRRRDLDNGLRVLVASQPGAIRPAVTVHYPVGFRSERPGEEGMAHLCEHLMFQGSRNLPDGAFYDHIARTAGTASGSTRSDYTEYCQRVPSSALEAALFAEADRMSAPMVTAEALAAQVAGVDQEIRATLVERPFGGFPWPAITAGMFTRFENAHDAYGDPGLLSSLAPADCAAFLDETYTPSTAILTVVGPDAPEDVFRLVHRHFDRIPSKPARPTPDLTEPSPAEDRRLLGTEPGTSRTAVAVGLRLPDAAAQLPAYLAHMVLAELLQRRAVADLGLPVSTSCGFFEPLDSRDPDAFVAATLLHPDTDPDWFLDAIRTMLQDLRTSDGRNGREVVERLAVSHERSTADPLERARGLGRFELLFGDAARFDALPQLLRDLDPDQVADAAAMLHEAPATVLTLEPGPVRSRPAWPVRDGSRPRAHTSSPPPGAPTGASPARPVVPSIASSTPPWPQRWTDTTDRSGLRIVAVEDPRARVAEVRLRLPLGPHVWATTGSADAVVEQLDRGGEARRRLDDCGGDLDVTTDGQWLQLRACAPDTHLAACLDTIAATLDQPAAAVTAGDTPRDIDPRRVADELLRRSWLDPAAGTSARVPGDDAMLPLPGPRGALIGVVARNDSAAVADAVRAAFAGWRPNDEVGTSAQSSSASARRLVTPGPFGTHVCLSAPEPPGGSEFARYLATSILGGSVGSRLDLALPDDAVGMAGRDMVLDRQRVFLQASSVGRDMAVLETVLAEQAERMAQTPPTTTEVEEAKEFCAAQALAAFDSPRALADLLVVAVRPGLRLQHLVPTGPDFWTTSVTDVQHAGRELFGGSFTTVVLDAPA